jgi:hypothetical protein
LRPLACLIAGAAIAGAIVPLYTCFSPIKDDLWGAVTPPYLKDALSDLAGKRKGWNPVLFCIELHSTGQAEIRPDCQEYLSTHQDNPTCGAQNLLRGNWETKILEAAPDKLARDLALRMRELRCTRLVLDVEGMRASDRDRLTQWLRALAGELRKTRRELFLSFPVHAKTHAGGDWEGAASEDWAALCPTFDELLIMAYDRNMPPYTTPGETAPIEWVRDVVDYALTTCSQKKLRLGLAAYGYDWKTLQPISERHGRPDSEYYGLIETEDRRKAKIELAHRLGIHKFFLWALGM